MKILKILTITLLLCSVSKLAAATETAIPAEMSGCSKEIKKYCKDITKKGADRAIACLYAYEDKLSNQCQFALYDLVTKLQHQVAKLSYVADECIDDLKKLCSGVQVGEGRLLRCLDKNSKKVSKSCKTALKQTGLR